jgi:hypothetical protein
MWEPRPLTPLWAFTACYRDRFTFFYFGKQFVPCLYYSYVTYISKLSTCRNRLVCPWRCCLAFGIGCVRNSSGRPYVLNAILQHPVALCILNQHFHFSPSLCDFVDVLKLILQKHSSLPVIWTLHVSRPNWLPSSRIQVVEETAILLSRF